MDISIHSPYTGRDTQKDTRAEGGRNFNPLSLYRERPSDGSIPVLFVSFQSTLPIQGETQMANCHSTKQTQFQSTLPIQGETLHDPDTFRRGEIFQSTLPIQGETVIELDVFTREMIFQSTLPIQGETPGCGWMSTRLLISIHSPYTGRDKEEILCIQMRMYFNPLSLYRERRFTTRLNTEL